MFLQYGSYKLDIGSAAVIPTIQSIFNSAGMPQEMKCSIQCQGTLLGASQNDIDAKLTQFLAAMAVPLQDVLFFRDDGQLSALRLRNKDSLQGVHVTLGPTFPNKQKGEYSSYLDFDLTFSA